MFDTLALGCQAAACQFDKALTPEALWYQVGLVFFAITYLTLTYRYVTKDTFIRFGIMLSAVALFEFFTSPMWVNLHLGKYSYIYYSVSWVLILGLTTMSLSIITIVDLLLPRLRGMIRYFVYLPVFMAVMYVVQRFLVHIDIRHYAPEVLAVIRDNPLPIVDVSWQALFYWIVFFSLVTAFYKFFVYATLESRPILPSLRGNYLRNLLITFFGVLFFEIMVDPMVVNAKLPAWSYIYRDVSIVMSGIWILLIVVAVTIIDRVCMHVRASRRFALYVGSISIVAIPIEALLMKYGYRVYEQSARDGFSGLVFPLTNVPMEVVFAVPFYLALVLGFVRYWQITLDNRL